MSDATPTVRERVHGSATDSADGTKTILTYDIVNVRQSACRFVWVSVNGGYKGRMTITVGDTVYYDEFNTAVPSQVWTKITGPSIRSDQSKVQFIFGKPQDVNITGYFSA